MADDTRVTQSRCAFACLVALMWALGLMLPGLSNAAVPTLPDPWFYFQWSLESPNDSDIDALSAWSHPGSGPGTEVKVGVVDQQIYSGHPDLAGRVDTGLAKDVFSGSHCTAGTPTYTADHGTHVAGIIAANRDNGIGIAGIAPDAQIVPIRDFDNCGGANEDDVIAAFKYAGEQHLPVVVASFSTDPLNQD